MKLNSMLLYLNDNFPELEDCKKLLEKGNPRIWKGKTIFPAPLVMEPLLKEWQKQ